MKTSARRKSELIFPAVILAGAVYLCAKAGAAVFPLILSIAFAYILNPFVKFFELRGFKRSYLVSGLYLVAGVLAIYLIYYLAGLISGEINVLTENWKGYVVKFQAFSIGLEQKIIATAPFMQDFLAKWVDKMGGRVAAFAETIPYYIVGMLPSLSLLILVPFLSFFFLLEGPAMINGFLNLIPSRHVETALHVLCEIDESLGNYLRGIMAEAFILFLLALIGMSLMNLEYAVAIAVIMGISSLVPYLGPIVGGALGGVAAFAQFYRIGPVIKVLLYFAALRFVDDWFLQPTILKQAVRIHPVIIVFSLLVGAELFGIWGIIFAMPVTCIIKVLLNIAFELHRAEFSWKPKPEPTRISIPYI
ncbi:MAG: AI-2E family transporter [Elusimicrobia bacterium]|nr:AI-2E family transporter [Elusimicrobiota bacterium]